ncbi:MAG: ABC transporter substrate-binding protein [Bacillota bacterium]|nr:ABC transporter substrate-binding protein [Bacillota bacterium]
MRGRVTARALVLVIVVALLGGALVGCRQPAPKPQGQAEIKPEDRILRMDEDWPTYIDPAVGNDFSDSIALVNLYDTLVFPNLDGSVRPHLATKWDVSPDGLKYTFYLRQGVKFHNGEELTAEDVEFSMKRLLTIGEGFAYLFKNVASAKAVDRYTVEFTLKEPFGPFVKALVRFYVLNKKEVLSHLKKPGQYGEMGDYGKEWLLTHDAGSGPYKVKEMKMEEYLLAEKFDEWWGGWDKDAPVYFKEIAAPDPVTIRTLMARREHELTDEFQPEENLAALEKIQGVQTAGFFNGNNLNIMLHTKKPPTDDIHFRRALAYCLDYETVVTKIWPSCKQARGPVPHNLPGHNPDVYQFKRDLQKAREELQKSKYYGQLDKYPVTLSWCAEVPLEEKLALLFQANAAELGIKVEVTKKPFGAMIADAQSPETTPNASIVYVAPHYPEAGSILTSRYHSSTCGSWEQCEWLQNKEIDAMIEQALSTVDEQKRFELYYKIQEKIVELCPTIWVLDQFEKRAYQAGYVYWPAGEAGKAGKTILPVMGYGVYAHDFRVYPEKKMELLKTSK